MNRLGVIGGGHAAIDLVRKLREGGFSDPIDILEKSNFFPHERPPLSKKGLTRELSPQDFSLASEASFAKLNVSFRRRSQVERLSIIGDSFQVTLGGGASVNYDQVILATGVRPRTLDLSVGSMTPVCYLQSLEDMMGIRAHLIAQKKVLIIGAGFIGLEVATSLRSLGHEVLVVEKSSQIMNRVLSEPTASFFQKAHEAMGTNIFLETGVQKVEINQVGQSTFVFSSGEKFTPDVVLVAIGVEPATEFIDLPVKMDGQHILVDSEGKTSVANLFAMGDLAARPNPADPTSVVKIQSIDAAALSSDRLSSHILGQKLQPYESWIPKFWSDQASHRLQIAGLRPQSSDVVVRGATDSSHFSIGFFQAERLLAIESVNSPVDFLHARKLMQSPAQISIQDFSDISFSLKTLEKV